MRWNLIPGYWREGQSKPPYMLHNARADGIDVKSSFRDAFRARRCIVPASGYFEWKTEPATGKKPVKRPFYMTFQDGSPMSFAGIWNEHQIDGEQVLSVAVVTTEPNAKLAKIHDRMPVIIGRWDINRWLSGDDPKTLLKSYPADAFKVTEVGPSVGSVKNQGEDCIAPLASE